VAEEVIGGYRLLKHLVTGQTSQVWEVVEAASLRHFAMKLLLPERARDPVHRKFLMHEALVGKQLAHPNIIKIISVVRDEKNPCIVMEFFPAGSLKLRLVSKQFDYIKEKAHTILKQTATGLAFMNAKGWVHKDVKLDNILANGVGEVRLIDFALAERIQTGWAAKFLRRKAKPQGTRSYMSPEQIRGQLLDARADIYSFGASAYELVTRRPPFRGMSAHDLLVKHISEKPLSPRYHNPEVTEEFADLVLRMLAKKKEGRPRDFHEVLMQLRTMRVFTNEAPQTSEV
jgi:serine/threonine-protein kinase